MNTLFWNCRGAGGAATVREIRELANKTAPTILCIIETQIDKGRVEAMKGDLGFDCSFAIDSQGRSGGIGVFWKDSIKLEILGSSCYHIDCSVTEGNDDPWRLTCV